MLLPEGKRKSPGPGQTSSPDFLALEGRGQRWGEMGGLRDADLKLALLKNNQEAFSPKWSTLGGRLKQL
jgi:hypothetical protein